MAGDTFPKPKLCKTLFLTTKAFINNGIFSTFFIYYYLLKGKDSFSLHSEIKTYDHVYALRQIPAKSYLAPLLAKKETTFTYNQC